MENKNFRLWLGLFLLFFPFNFFWILIVLNPLLRPLLRYIEYLVYEFVYTRFDPRNIFSGRVFSIIYNFTSFLAVCWGIYLLSKKNLNVKRFAAFMISGAAAVYIIILYSIRRLENKNLMFQGYIFTVVALSLFAGVMFILGAIQLYRNHEMKEKNKKSSFTPLSLQNKNTGENQNMKMWAGRFAKDTDRRVNDFNSSLSFDRRMYREDIEGSVAHAAMLGKRGIIAPAESEKIIAGLKSILADIESGALIIEGSAAEDIHMFVEQELTSRIGEAGKRLHTARSRNDQVALDIRLYLRRETDEIKELLIKLLSALAKKAEANTDTVMPGYTHLQRAQPVSYAHYLMAYAAMFMRDIARLGDCRRRMNVMPLGSGALASTTYPIDREAVREALGFDTVTLNSIDGVSDRDFVIELLSALSLIMTHLSRFSEEIILWCSSEFAFLELDDAFSTGSSIMPQKKNPDVAELVRGKTGRVYGSLTTLLTVMKGLPLAYNKDMQEDKEAAFDAVDNTKLSLEVFTAMFETLTVRADKMRAAASAGYMNATDCADYLVRKGLPFRDAYRVSGTLVGKYTPQGKPLEALTLDELNASCAALGLPELFEDDVYESISLDACVAGRKVPGGPAPEEVKIQIKEVKRFIDENSEQG